MSFSPILIVQEGNTPLRLAVQEDNTHIAKLLLEGGADVSKLNQDFTGNGASVAMTQEHHDALRRNRFALIEAMDARALMASDTHLKDIFSVEDKEHVVAMPPGSERNEVLLDLIHHHGEKAFDAFCKALIVSRIFIIIN